MIHRKHRLEIREFERRMEEICRDVASTVVSTATEYTMRLRLEVAKVAEKAGLLWFDAHEGRWRIQG